MRLSVVAVAALLCLAALQMAQVHGQASTPQGMSYYLNRRWYNLMLLKIYPQDALYLTVVYGGPYLCYDITGGVYESVAARNLYYYSMGRNPRRQRIRMQWWAFVTTFSAYESFATMCAPVSRSASFNNIIPQGKIFFRRNQPTFELYSNYGTAPNANLNQQLANLKTNMEKLGINDADYGLCVKLWKSNNFVAVGFKRFFAVSPGSSGPGPNTPASAAPVASGPQPGAPPVFG